MTLRHPSTFRFGTGLHRSPFGKPEPCAKREILDQYSKDSNWIVTPVLWPPWFCLRFNKWNSSLCWITSHESRFKCLLCQAVPAQVSTSFENRRTPSYDTYINRSLNSTVEFFRVNTSRFYTTNTYLPDFRQTFRSDAGGPLELPFEGLHTVFNWA